MRAPFAAFDAPEHATRLTRARAAMRNAGLRALVCCAPENGFYLAGYDSWTAVNSPQMLVFTDAEDVPTLLLRNVDLPLARESSWLDDLRCYHLNRDQPALITADLLAERGVHEGAVGVDLGAAGVSGALLRALETALSPLRIVDATRLLVGDGDIALQVL